MSYSYIVINQGDYIMSTTNEFFYPEDDTWQQEWASHFTSDYEKHTKVDYLCRFEHVLRGTPCIIGVRRFTPYFPPQITFSADSSYPPEGGEVDFDILDISGNYSDELMNSIDSLEIERIQYRAMMHLDPNWET